VYGVELTQFVSLNGRDSCVYPLIHCSSPEALRIDYLIRNRD
jgi:hypothetical protein